MSLKIHDLKILPHLASLWLIARSRIFNAGWYRAEYPACEALGLSPIVHYVLAGAAQGARPHLLFDPAWYRRGRGGEQSDPNPLLDYIKYGAAQGSDPSPYFSSAYYRDSAGDLGGLTPLGHFIAYGLSRGTAPSPFFDRDWYLANNPDVRRAGFDPVLHFAASGSRDGRSPGPLFDAGWYRMKNVDMRDRGLEPLSHYLGVGAAQGRKPHERFDPAFYVANAPRPSGLEAALTDYAEHGRSEWRSTHPVLPPPASPIATFEEFPWRRSPSQEFDQPFRVLIVDVGGAPSAASEYKIDICDSLKRLPQLDVHIFTDDLRAVAQQHVAALDFSSPDLAALKAAVVLDRLLRALKFRDANALVIEINCAIAPLQQLCAALGLAYCAKPCPAHEVDWSTLLRRHIGYRAAPPPTISVIVPNYNHARYLDERLGSILAQRLRPNEIIFLDDGSSDESLDIAEAWKDKSPVPFTILRSAQNSGSPFKQWAKGAAQANCDLVWIAESDDSSDARFLEHLRAAFIDPGVVMAYCDSQTVGMEGEVLSQSYRFYTDTLDETRWLSAYVASGPDEVEAALSIKNTIPNVSAVLFRRSALQAIIDEVGDFRYCGDWKTYVECLRRGKIGFYPQALNNHRRDPGSVTPDGERGTLAVKEALAIKRGIFANHQCTDKAIWRSLSQTIFEYELRSTGLGREAFLDNEDLAAAIRDVLATIERRRFGYALQEENVECYLRTLAEQSVTLDKAARQAVVDRVTTALRTLASRET